MPQTHLNEPIASPGVTDVTQPLQVAGVVFPSLARIVAVYTSNEVFNPDAKGLRLYFDISVHNGGTIVGKIQTRDPVTDNWVDLTGGTTAALAGANQTRTLTIYPGITVAAGTATTNTEISNFVDVAWRLVVTVTTATVTFSVGAVSLL